MKKESILVPFFQVDFLGTLQDGNEIIEETYDLAEQKHIPFGHKITPFRGEYSKKKSRKMLNGGGKVTFCEDCRWYKQSYWEDRATCQKKQKPAEATDPACEEYEAPEGQMKMEV